MICVNINDWKFVNSNYGDEEGDRLIKTVADILKREADVYKRQGADLVQEITVMGNHDHGIFKIDQKFL